MGYVVIMWILIQLNAPWWIYGLLLLGLAAKILKLISDALRKEDKT